jgi:hypothetical protein
MQIPEFVRNCELVSACVCCAPLCVRHRDIVAVFLKGRLEASAGSSSSSFLSLPPPSAIIIALLSVASELGDQWYPSVLMLRPLVEAVAADGASGAAVTAAATTLLSRYEAKGRSMG